jgi:RNA polymerase sigma-70 factor (ECF subfamily)
MLRGDRAAFDEFFESYFQGLYRFALSRMGRDADAAEEVAQATLCAAISKLHTYRGEAALFSWLCTFCRHEISAFYTRRRRRPETVDLLEDTPEVQGALESLWVLSGDDPERATYREEIARFVQVTLDRLPRHYGDALEWKYIEGLSVKEIATRLGLGPKAAESVLTRARQAFRDGFSSIVSHPRAATFGEPTPEGVDS